MRVVAALTTLALGLTVATASAQSGLSVVAGVVSSNVSGDDVEGIASKIGFAAGLGLNGGSATGLSFNPEALYVMKGIKDDGDGDSKIKLNYIEVPLLFRYQFQGGSSATPYITGGPTISYLASCKESFEDDSADCDDDQFKSIDYGVMFGIGLNMSRINLSARYEIGVANILDTNDDADNSIKNKMFMVALGIAI